MDETKHGLILDLNKYRVRDLKPYIDAGVDGFIFRIGGPTQWVEGDYKYAEDATWRPYMDQADKYSIPRGKIGAYIVHNAFEDYNAQLDYDVHVNLLNQWTGGGYMPGYFILDHEVNYVWRGGVKIIITGPNLVNSLAAVTDKIYKKWHKMVVIYTGRWFIDQNNPSGHMVYLDNINRPEVGKQRPMWYAYYQNEFDTKTYTNLRAAITDLDTPTGDSIGKYLQCGSYSLADLWQFTSKLKLAGDTIGVDANITLGTLAQYWAAVGYTGTEPDPDPDPEPDPDLAALTLRVAAIEAKLAGVKAAL